MVNENTAAGVIQQAAHMARGSSNTHEAIKHILRHVSRDGNDNSALLAAALDHNQELGKLDQAWARDNLVAIARHTRSGDANDIAAARQFEQFETLGKNMVHIKPIGLFRHAVKVVEATPEDAKLHAAASLSVLQNYDLLPPHERELVRMEYERTKRPALKGVPVQAILAEPVEFRAVAATRKEDASAAIYAK